MLRNRYLPLLIVCFFMLILVGCSGPPDPDLNGNWKGQTFRKGQLLGESSFYFKDGKTSVNVFGKSKNGFYTTDTSVDPHRIKFDWGTEGNVAYFDWGIYKIQESGSLYMSISEKINEYPPSDSLDPKIGDAVFALNRNQKSMTVDEYSYFLKKLRMIIGF
ncbi:MAG TPA: hypothetical protein PLT82_07305 [Candidatus Hydrogenedens sp.]|nr:hypothetical protein [Candidatus Hydrogenedens sp.]HOL19251.1 hypothetical protein [Candidatus Hydrogenedens sp.]HPP58922.1 hypothetical protein [Candidatus Hydrogenedens sp.]